MSPARAGINAESPRSSIQLAGVGLALLVESLHAEVTSSNSVSDDSLTQRALLTQA